MLPSVVGRRADAGGGGAPPQGDRDEGLAVAGKTPVAVGKVAGAAGVAVAVAAPRASEECMNP